MKKYFLILFLTISISANECTKSEIIDFIHKGFSKSEIVEICNKTTASPKCCCSVSTYEMEYGDWVYQHTNYKWLLADNCYSKKTRFLQTSKTINSCTNKQSCGR